MPIEPENLPAGLTVSLVSLGCPKNLIDSEKMLAFLAEGGCLVGAPMEEADVIVINTCGFLSDARDESLEMIAEAARCKNEGRAQRIVVTGCLPERDKESLFELAPEIDAIVGVNDRDRIFEAVTGQEDVLLKPYSGGINNDAGRFRLTSAHTAYLRIAEGCSNRCTFCTIPDIRGPFRSKQPGDVIIEARELIDDGALELNVIAQDTTSYGSDLGNTDLSSLLRQLDTLNGAQWIRLMYTYPHLFTRELVDTIIQCEHVVPYVDIPLQHISDPILKRMGRRVTRSEIETLLAILRDANIAVRTTFIVGFPGETDDNFQQLLGLVKDFGFDAMGVFAFSAETGTPAMKLPDHLPADLKAERARLLMEAQQEVVFSANKQAIGCEVDVIVDGFDDLGQCIGRHAGQAPEIDSICYLTNPQAEGTIVNGTITDWHEYDLVVDAGEGIDMEAGQ